MNTMSAKDMIAQVDEFEDFVDKFCKSQGTLIHQHIKWKIFYGEERLDQRNPRL